jgi:hypothetical protein
MNWIFLYIASQPRLKNPVLRQFRAFLEGGESMDSNQINVNKLVAAAALITLAVTLLRLVGELLGWSRALFSPEAGGGGSPVGIVWLVPVFGIYFAWRLVKAGQASVGAGRTIGFALLGLAIVIVTSIVLSLIAKPTEIWVLIVISLVSLVGAYVAAKGWSKLASILLIYGLAARIPVAVVMFFAILGNWGTHYDVVPDPDFPAMGWFAKWVVIGLIPQLTIWVAFTVIVGAIFGGITVALVGRRSSV